MPLRVDLTTGGNQYRADAINYATAHAIAHPDRRYVINCSWGTNGDHAGIRTAIQNAVYYHNVVVVVSAGNDNADANSFHRSTPVCIPKSLPSRPSIRTTVRPAFPTSARMSMSAAPGVKIRSTVRPITNHGVTIEYGYLSGTSQAAPLVAGVAALIWSGNRDVTNDQVRQIIESTCDNIDSTNPGFVGMLGRGRVNASAAVSEAVRLAPGTGVSGYSFDAEGTQHVVYCGARMATSINCGGPPPAAGSSMT